MKITVWGINYSPELTGIAPFNTALCEYLASRSHAVSMVTSFPYYPEWKKRTGDQGRLSRVEEVRGVTVSRLWHYVPVRLSAIKRMIHEASFVICSFVRLIFMEAPDVFVVVSPPLALGIGAWLIGKIKNAPFVFHVQDLQPDAAVGLRMLKEGMFTRILYWMEGFAYSKAAKVSGISPGVMNAFRRKGVPEDKIVYFPNGMALPLKLPTPGAFRVRHSLKDSVFVAVYSGNLGVKQGLDVLIDAAVHLSEVARNGDDERRGMRRVKCDIAVVIAGDGARREQLACRVAELKLDNVLLLSLLPEREYWEMMVDADCAVITQQEGTGQFFFPSKLLAALAAGKPVLSVADDVSELARACIEGRFGVNVPPGQPEAVAGALLKMAESKSCDPVCNLEDVGSMGSCRVLAGASAGRTGPVAQRVSYSLAQMREAGLAFVGQFEAGRVHGRFEEVLKGVAARRE